MFRWVSYIIVVLLAMIQPIYAGSKTLTVDFEEADLPEAIQFIAQFLQVNVMVSPTVNGVITLHLKDVKPLDAFEALLLSQKLSKRVMGRIWLIAPRDELIHTLQADNRLRDIQNDAVPLDSKVWQIQYGKAEEIAKLLKNEQNGLLSKHGHVRVDARTNTLIIQDFPARITLVNKLIPMLDVPLEQIRIKARIVSIEHDFERELGIQLGLFAHTDKKRSTQAGFSVLKLADSALLDIKLSALEKSGHARLISSPSLFTANRETASIESGEEIPYQALSETGGTVAVFKKAVLGLKVTPQVLPHNQVLLHMQINQDRPSNKMVQGVPTISTRQIITHALIKDGQTIVLGGIYESSREEGREGIPFLKLLGRTEIHNNKRELLIFVTPTILKVT